ncbi:MAG: Maf family protein [Clostridia bacterium]|nr:Maf family protein [Clostridia bacterium]
MASGSPRRRQLLKEVVPSFEVVKVDADETCLLDSPAQRVMYTAGIKAEGYPLSEGEVLVTADTTVYCQGQFLGKPQDADEATRMLDLLNHCVHSVWTGVCIRTTQWVDYFASESKVRIDMTAQEIAAYVATGSPLDKAGAYGIQDDLCKATLIEGELANVIGLPIRQLKQVLDLHRV